jgi:large subunit ribosomal protein L21
MKETDVRKKWCNEKAKRFLYTYKNILVREIACTFRLLYKHDKIVTIVSNYPLAMRHVFATLSYVFCNVSYSVNSISIYLYTLRQTQFLLHDTDKENAMRAIVEISGKQYQVEAGKYIDIDTYTADVDTALTFENVNLVMDGETSHLGMPFVKGAKVTATVMAHGRQKKILVYKMRPKKGYRKKNGHRQGYTRIMVNAITV